jgi:hypothetical protein
VSLSPRLAAIVAMLTLSVGNLAVCAGWQATPEARMACCINATSCPMHKSASHRSGSTRIISQVQADNCCAAASNRTQSSVAGTTFVVAHTTALPPLTDFIVPVPTLALQEWRALVPLPVSAVPKHLLLSVLLV